MDDLISLPEAAKLLNLHPETLRRWDRQGRLEAVKVGTRKDRRYKKTDIEKLLSPHITTIQKDDTLSKNEYISPKAKIYDDFSKAEHDREKYGYLYFSDEVIDALDQSIVYSRSFVLAEAGFGKTRLLKEVANKVNNITPRNALIIDLKLFAQSGYSSLSEYIKQKEPNIFSSDLSKIFIGLDGLDEVKASDFNITVDRIKDFVNEYPQISMLISSRWHFYKKRQQDFGTFDFSIITLMPFEHEEILKFLQKNSISKNDQEKILDTLSAPGRDLIIKTPRYLELLVQYVKEKGVKQANKLKRTDLFEYFIYSKLILEDKRQNEQRTAMFKRILERLALTMEIYQTNVITKEEFIIFLEEADSTSASALISEDLLNIFYEKSLLVNDDTTIRFENTEFQEYLAAKHLLSLQQPFHNLYNLVVEENFREIHPSWFATLSYLVELKPKYLEPLIAFGKANHTGLVEDEQYHRLLTKFNLDKLSTNDKNDIFIYIFSYYQNVLNWISYEIGQNLAYYFSPSLNILLKKYAERKDYFTPMEKNVQLGNVALIVGYIKKIGAFSNEEEDYWREKLLGMLAIEGNGVLQRHALFALEQYKNDSLIDKVIFLQNNKEKLVRERLLNFCISVNPNHPTSINLFVNNLAETFLYGGYEGLQQINTPKSILKMLELILTDAGKIHIFLERDKNRYIGHKSNKILTNIRKNWNKEIGDKLEALIILSFNSQVWSLAEDSDFISQAAILVDEHKPGLIFRLIEESKKSDLLTKNLFSLQGIFTSLLKKGEVEKFVKAVSSIEYGKSTAFWTLKRISFSQRSDAKQIYEEGRNIFSEDYEKLEKSDTKENTLPDRNKELYDEFRFKLQPEEKKFMMDVFEYFNRYEDIIKRYWTEEDKKRLRELVIDSVFEKFDPRGQELIINKQVDNSRTYTMSSWIHIFRECIKIAKNQDLSIDTSKYRRKIAAYIPFAAFENTLLEILELLGNLHREEIEDLLNVYINKESDLWKFNPRSLIEVVKKQKITDAAVILKSFVNNEEFQIFERVDALEALSFIGENKEYFEKTFNKYEKSLKALSQMANKILITNFEDKKAINWRFEQIKLKAKPFNMPDNVHPVGDLEEELQDKSFALPLLSLKNPSYESEFLNLLKKSFELLEADEKFYDYAAYIWGIVYKYFDNRKIDRSYKPLESLENFVKENSNKNGSNWFITQLAELRKAYLLYIGKPESFANSIAIYNQVKKNSYLPIATNEDLYQKIKQIVKNEIQDYLHSEGASLLKSDESTIQKSLQIAIKNKFLEEKLVVNILREPQAIDNTRCDYLIFYGFLGPILIELKLASNSDLKGKNLQSKTSHKRLQQYMTNYKAYKGILLVIDNVKRTAKTKSSNEHNSLVEHAYSNLKNIEVIWQNISES